MICSCEWDLGGDRTQVVRCSISRIRKLMFQIFIQITVTVSTPIISPAVSFRNLARQTMDFCLGSPSDLARLSKYDEGYLVRPNVKQIKVIDQKMREFPSRSRILVDYASRSGPTLLLHR